jgi:hypothetical protein
LGLTSIINFHAVDMVKLYAIRYKLGILDILDGFKLFLAKLTCHKVIIFLDGEKNWKKWMFSSTNEWGRSQHLGGMFSSFWWPILPFLDAIWTLSLCSMSLCGMRRQRVLGLALATNSSFFFLFISHHLDFYI